MDEPPLPRPNLERQTSGDLDLAQSLQNLNIATTTSLPPSPSPVRQLSLSDRRSPSPLVVRKRGSLAGQGGTQAPGSPGTPIRRHASYHQLPMSSPTPGAGPGTPGATNGNLSRKTSISSMGQTENMNGNTPVPPITDRSAETLAIISDASYLHKFSRDWEKATYKDTIVERPERMVAAVLGVSAAISKLTPSKLSILKTERIGSLADPAVTTVHGEAYPPALASWCENSATKLQNREIELPDVGPSGEYISNSDMYLCPETRRDLEGCLGAVFEGTDRVFGDRSTKTDGQLKSEYPRVKRAFLCIRPPGHHCGEDTPSGFCYLNNVQVAISYAARVHGLTHAVILDFDLHHGDGSQDIAWSLNDKRFNTKGSVLPTIAYYSLHDIKSYPCESGNPDKIINASVCLEDAFGQNIWNVHLEAYSDENHFYQLYEGKYRTILAKAKSFLARSRATYKPPRGQAHRKFKAGVFISAGFDASHYEGAHMQRHAVNVPTSFFARFTSDCVKMADEYAEGRVLSVLEGGYEDRALWTGVFSHLCGLAAPQAEFVNGDGSRSVPIPQHIRPSIDGLSMQPADERLMALYPQIYSQTYDPSWFNYGHLAQVEEAVVTTHQKKIERETSYFSPTASSVAKVSAPMRLKRQSSSSFNHTSMERSSPSPVPQLRSIEWGPLSALVWFSLVPTQEIPAPKPPKPPKTTEKNRLAKRHSVVGVPEIDGDKGSSSRMSLRERKKPAVPTVQENAPIGRPSKTTVAAARKPDIPARGASTGKTAVSSSSSYSYSSHAAAASSSSSAATAARKAADAMTNTKARQVQRKSNGAATKATTTKTAGQGAPRSSSGESKASSSSAPAGRESSIDSVTDNVRKLKITYKNKERDEQMEKRSRDEQHEESKLRKQIASQEGKIKKLQNKQKFPSKMPAAKSETAGDAPITSLAAMSVDEERMREEQLEAKILEMELQEQKDVPPLAITSPVETKNESDMFQLTPKATQTNFGQSSVSAPPSTNPTRIKSESVTPTYGNTPTKVSDRKKMWEIGDELTPARVYNPKQGNNQLGPHGTGQLGQDGSLKKPEIGVDMDRNPPPSSSS